MIDTRSVTSYKLFDVLYNQWPIEICIDYSMAVLSLILFYATGFESFPFARDGLP